MLPYVGDTITSLNTISISETPLSSSSSLPTTTIRSTSVNGGEHKQQQQSEQVQHNNIVDYYFGNSTHNDNNNDDDDDHDMNINPTDLDEELNQSSGHGNGRDGSRSENIDSSADRIIPSSSRLGSGISGDRSSGRGKGSSSTARKSSSTDESRPASAGKKSLDDKVVGRDNTHSLKPAPSTVSSLAMEAEMTNAADADEQSSEPAAAVSKKRTWKKPKDKPKRPLSSYNIYFQHQRERIVEGKTGEASPEEVVTSVEAILSKSKTKRRHRKSHGKISFGDLARSIAESWKSVSARNKTIFEHYAERDMLRYKRELKVWRDKKDMEIEADAQARHSKFISSMGTSVSGSVDSEVSASHTSTSDFINSLPDEGNAKTADSSETSKAGPKKKGRPEHASFNSSLSSLDSQPKSKADSRRSSSGNIRRRSGTQPLAEASSPVATMSMADQVIQRQQQILSQQMMLDRSNNTTSSSSMNMSMSSAHNTPDRTYGNSNFMPPASFTMGPSSVHSMPQGFGMGGNMGGNMGMLGHSRMGSFGPMGMNTAGVGSMSSLPSSNPSAAMMGGDHMMPMGMNMGGLQHGSNPNREGMSMSFQQNHPMGDMSFQQQLQQRQQRQQQQTMAMLNSSSNSLQFGDVLGGGGSGQPNLVSDHTRTSMGQHSALNNSQSSFAGFGNSMSSFGGVSMMPQFNTSAAAGLSSSSHHGSSSIASIGTGGNSGGIGTPNRQLSRGGMMSQLGMPSQTYHGGMNHAGFPSLQRRQQQQQQQLSFQGGNMSSASYHSGMRPTSMHGGMLQQETIDEHSHQDQDYESSFAFPQGEGFYDNSDD